MSFDVHRAHRAGEALRTATETDGARGAIAGAAGLTGTTAVALGLAGLALAPAGLVLVASTGAVLGGFGVFKKLRARFH